MISKRLWFILGVALAGCNPSYAANFTPYSATQPSAPPITARALLIYPGDVDILTRAGGSILGSIRIDGDPSDVDFRQVVGEEAARRGGTHFILRGSGATGMEFSRGLTGVVATESGEGYEFYVVLHVPRERWAELPEPLRPR